MTVPNIAAAGLPDNTNNRDKALFKKCVPFVIIIEMNRLQLKLATLIIFLEIALYLTLKKKEQVKLATMAQKMLK